MEEIGVIHLVRAANGIEHFQRFLAAYTRYQGPLRHDLLIVFKGFCGDHDLDSHRRLLKGVPYRHLRVADVGYDLQAYHAAIKHFHNRYFCFLNSFSEIRMPGWLALMHHHLSGPGVGAVGASGNLISWYTSLLADWRQLLTYPQYRGTLGRTRLRLRRALYRAVFPPFPNPHLRTNAFMLSRALLLRIRYWPRFGKLDSYRFESGLTGITRQLYAHGLKVLVVGTNGRAYLPHEWAESQTFWQGGQENLLVADKQTRRFADADETTRRELTRIAWNNPTNGSLMNRKDPRTAPPRLGII